MLTSNINFTNFIINLYIQISGFDTSSKSSMNNPVLLFMYIIDPTVKTYHNVFQMYVKKQNLCFPL